MLRKILKRSCTTSELADVCELRISKKLSENMATDSASSANDKC
jgi:hypothetical protein